MPIVQRITGIGNVTQGSTALVALDTGPRYFWLKFWFYVNNVLTAADQVVDMVRLKVNEKAQRELTAARILKLNAYKAVPDSAGCLSIHLAEPGMADKMDEVFTAWDTNGENSFTVEFELKTLAQPTDVIRIVGAKSYDFGMLAGPNNTRLKRIVRQSVQTETLPLGAYDLVKFPTVFPIRAIHMDAPSAITLVEVDRDGERVWEASDVQQRALVGDYGQVGNTFAYSLDFCYREQISDALIVRSTLNVRATSAAAQTVNSIIENIVTSFDA